MSQKSRISAKEIVEVLNEALRRRDQCATMRATRVFETSGGPANWDADISIPEGGTVGTECKRVMLATKLGLQNRFDLATD